MLLWKLLVLRFDSFHFIYGLRFWFSRCWFFSYVVTPILFSLHNRIEFISLCFCIDDNCISFYFHLFPHVFYPMHMCANFWDFDAYQFASIPLSLSVTRSVARYRPNNSNNHSNNKNQNALDYKRSEWNANGWQNGISYHRSMMIFGIVFGVKCYRIKMLKTTMVKI